MPTRCISLVQAIPIISVDKRFFSCRDRVNRGVYSTVNNLSVLLISQLSKWAQAQGVISMKWQVTFNGKTKVYANMNTASAKVEQLRLKGDGATLSPVM